MRLLIVDDSRTMRNILEAYARELDCEVAGAADGVEALDVLGTEPGAFDAAILDWDMPRMNGLETLKAIRADHRFDHLKVMMVTAQNSMDRVSEALAAGADDYLMKPVDNEMFTDKLRLLGLVL